MNAQKNKAQDSKSQTKYLSFKLGDEHYAMKAVYAQEIIEARQPTQVHNMPDEVVGVSNLRGKIIPIIDLRIKFGLGTGTLQKHNANIITEFQNEDDTQSLYGLTVDCVEDVLIVNEDQIENTTGLSNFIDEQYICGIHRCDGKLYAILDTDKLLSL